MKVGISVLMMGIFLILTLPLEAHHSQATFYFLDRTEEVTGVVVDLRLVNPHSYMLVEVTEPDGETVVWTIYGGNRVEMSNAAGWEEGRAITAVGCPARNPEAHGMYLGNQCSGSELTLLPGE